MHVIRVPSVQTTRTASGVHWSTPRGRITAVDPRLLGGSSAPHRGVVRRNTPVSAHQRAGPIHELVGRPKAGRRRGERNANHQEEGPLGSVVVLTLKQAKRGGAGGARGSGSELKGPSSVIADTSPLPGRTPAPVPCDAHRSARRC